MDNEIMVDDDASEGYEAPDVSRLGSTESLTAGGTTFTDVTDVASIIIG